MLPREKKVSLPRQRKVCFSSCGLHLDDVNNINLENNITSFSQYLRYQHQKRLLQRKKYPTKLQRIVVSLFQMLQQRETDTDEDMVLAAFKKPSSQISKGASTTAGTGKPHATAKGVKKKFPQETNNQETNELSDAITCKAAQQELTPKKSRSGRVIKDSMR